MLVVNERSQVSVAARCEHMRRLRRALWAATPPDVRAACMLRRRRCRSPLTRVAMLFSSVKGASTAPMSEHCRQDGDGGLAIGVRAAGGRRRRRRGARSGGFWVGGGRAGAMSGSLSRRATMSLLPSKLVRVWSGRGPPNMAAHVRKQTALASPQPGRHEQPSITGCGALVRGLCRVPTLRLGSANCPTAAPMRPCEPLTSSWRSRRAEALLTRSATQNTVQAFILLV